MQRDEVLVEIETDKVVLEVPASEAGILDAIVEEEGATVLSRQLLGRIRRATAPASRPLRRAKRKKPRLPSALPRARKKKAMTRSARRFVA